jgi:hypothetical protein
MSQAIDDVDNDLIHDGIRLVDDPIVGVDDVDVDVEPVDVDDVDVAEVFSVATTVMVAASTDVNPGGGASSDCPLEMTAGALADAGCTGSWIPACWASAACWLSAAK